MQLERMAWCPSCRRSCYSIGRQVQARVETEIVDVVRMKIRTRIYDKVMGTVEEGR